jgi:transposase
VSQQQTNQMHRHHSNRPDTRFSHSSDNSFTWPAIKNGVMRLEPAQFEALFAGLDWRRVQPLEVATPAAAE